MNQVSFFDKAWGAGMLFVLLSLPVFPGFAQDPAPHPDLQQPATGYQFRNEDKKTLQLQFQDKLKDVDLGRRPQYRSSESIPSEYRDAIIAVPAAGRRNLMELPKGYAVGYSQGYALVYDPKNFVVLTAIDLIDP